MNNSILGNITSADYMKNAVIEPPKDFDENLRITRIVVDSRARNRTIFPSPNSYDFDFDDDINDVVSATLKIADIPMPLYLINSYFNKLVVNIGGVDYTVELSNGDYTATEIATELQTKTSTVTGSTVTVSYITRTDNFKFVMAQPFTLKFKGYSNPLNQLLGFGVKDYIAVSGIGGYEIVGEYRKNFEYNNYLILDIETFDNLKSIDRDLNKSFAIIPKNPNMLNIVDDFDYVKKFSPPINKVARLKIRFYDRFGNPYDFQNFDHRFEIVFMSHKQRRKYGNIFS